MQIQTSISRVEKMPRTICYITLSLSLAFTFIGLSFVAGNAVAVTPAPDGGYPNGNTAEGISALNSLDTSNGVLNTAVGGGALSADRVGDKNTATGFEALVSNLSDDNTAAGFHALAGNTTGTQNTAVGSEALFGIIDQGGNGGSTASYNTATGFRALYSIVNGGGNLADGWQALYSNTSGYYNTASGTSALRQNTTGINNTASGVNALYWNNGSNNTGFGAYSLQQNQTGEYNTAAGANALFSNTDGLYNTATGYQALHDNTHGSSNTAVGLNALTHSIDAANNTAVGTEALEDNDHGENNTAIGTIALLFATGSNNVAIGYKAGYNLKSTGGNIVIGANVLGNTTDANITRIGTTSQKKTFIGGIYNKTVASGVGVIVNSNGQLGTVQSSARYKDDIKPMERTSEAILTLKPVTFRYKEELDPDKIPQFGLIAEEVEKVNPDLVVRDDDGKVMTVRYDAVYAMLLNEFLKEHQKVDEQAATIARLAKQVETLSAGLQKVTDKIQRIRPAVQVAANQ